MLLRTRPTAVGALSLAVALSSILGATTSTASAAPPAPTGLQTIGEVQAGLPVLQWRPVGSAASYEVQVDDDSGFGSPTFTTKTENVYYAYTKTIGAGRQFWRVRALDSNRDNSAWSAGSFTVDRTPSPSPTAPADGALLPQPGQPPLLQWSVVGGAREYVVQLDDEDGFAGSREYTTAASSIVVPDPLSPDKTYFWRVKAVRDTGIESAYSTVRAFTVGSLAVPEVVSPDDSPTNDISDVVLDWRPVTGARYYDVEVSTDDDFATSTIIDSRSKVTGTRYSPPITYDNDQYYWRVRAVSSDSTVKSDWSPAVNQFRRSWPHQPTAIYPLSTSTGVTDSFFYEWTPVKHASRYQLQVATNAAFDNAQLCVTAGTTFTPGTFRQDDALSRVRPRDLAGCRPAVLGPTYWRVRPFDHHPSTTASVQGLFSATQQFTYEPRDFRTQPSGSMFSPANGATVDVPTVTWTPLEDAETYEVRIIDAGGTAVSETTHATSFTPTRRLRAENGPFRWTVRAVESDGGAGSPVYESTFNLSGNAGPSGTPLAATSGDATSARRVPSLAWVPYPGAEYYGVRTYNAGTNNFAAGDSELATTRIYQPAVTYADEQLLRDGDYEWVVTAYDRNGVPLSSSSRHQFTIQALDPVGGQRLALGGNALRLDQGCTIAIVDAGECTDLPTTPTLAWDAVQGAAFYQIYVANDDKFTNMLELTATPATMWTPSWNALNKTIPESQAGASYYWFIRPCKSKSVCGTASPISVTPSKATNEFRKKSPDIQGGVAQAGTGDGTEVEFRWTDYRDTNAASSSSWVARPGVPAVEPNQSAQAYRIEVSPTSSFVSTNLLDSAVVDQPTYTSFAKLYRDGPVFWRVRAIDGGDNDLAWSSTYTYAKESPRASLTAPVNNAQIRGSVPLQWAPQAYAQKYEVQVAANNDVNFSRENLLFSDESVPTAYTWDEVIPASPLPYVWRVRRVDSTGNPGAWSAPRRFTNPGANPSLALPANNATVAAARSLFSWSLVPGAASYQIEIRQGGRTQTFRTAANAYAPTSAFSTGARTWRVVALDANREPVGASASRTFYVDATAPDLLRATPTGTIKRRVTFKLTFSEPVVGASARTVRLVKRGTTKTVPAKVAVVSGGRIVTLKPKVKLAKMTSYELLVGPGIRDRQGNVMRSERLRVQTGKK